MTTPPSAERPAWRVVVEAGAQKSLRRLGRKDRERIVAAIHRLPQGDTKKLVGSADRWRLRVGDWRVRFIQDQVARTFVITAVASRGSAYKP